MHPLALSNWHKITVCDVLQAPNGVHQERCQPGNHDVCCLAAPDAVTHCHCLGQGNRASMGTMINRGWVTVSRWLKIATEICTGISTKFCLGMFHFWNTRWHFRESFIGCRNESFTSTFMFGRHLLDQQFQTENLGWETCVFVSANIGQKPCCFQKCLLIFEI